MKYIYFNITVTARESPVLNPSSQNVHSAIFCGSGKFLACGTVFLTL